MQLSLFNYTVSYWAHPFDKNGNEIKNVMCLYIEQKTEYKLHDFISMLKLIDSKNIKVTIN